ncbi:peptide/nickel transport system permease protein [Shimia gijangensis]|uniref:Peptide/nickel transport system permease protein n=1 Tax=Shimia gijangensis TaxID=1470563 RepID=A0A1M6N3Z5_9RHOB|nr:ABC transporter permease [Shimia gijangensis]SHJ90414.1 peptide/nickel transport system permease protein [Shimia gijangensis]
MIALIQLILSRVALGLLTLLIVSAVIFLSVELLPGDLAQEILGQRATEESVAAMRRDLGLDRPLIERYVSWLGGALRGDFGVSLANGRAIQDLIGERFINTLLLAAYTASIAVPVAISLGLAAALYRNSIFDRMVNVTTLITISFPEFFVGYILILFLSSKLGWFPGISNIRGDVGFFEFLYKTFLPALTLTLVITAHMMRMTRAAIINLLARPYIEMADLKGMPRRRIILKHALPNALAPIINVIALNMAYLITGVVLVEVVFVYPGLGQLLVDSVSKRDVTVVQAACLIFASVYIILNLTADVLSIVTNPRLMHKK